MSEKPRDTSSCYVVAGGGDADSGESSSESICEGREKTVYPDLVEGNFD